MDPLLEQRAVLESRVVLLKKHIRDKRDELARTAQQLVEIRAECQRRGLDFPSSIATGVEVTHGR